MRLGYNNSSHIRTPKLLMKDETIIKISTAYNHTLIFKKNGDVIGFGLSVSGRFLVNEESTFPPKKIMSDPKLKSVFCGYNGSFFLMQDGSLFFHGRINEKEYKNHLVISNNSIKFINHMIDSEWTPESHHLFSEFFKISVLSFVCCLKVLNKKYKIKVPKYLIFMIVKFSV